MFSNYLNSEFVSCCLVGLRERLDPVKARDESWIEKLLLVSGWPACVMDFIRACRAPIDEVRSVHESSHSLNVEHRVARRMGSTFMMRKAFRFLQSWAGADTLVSRFFVYKFLARDDVLSLETRYYDRMSCFPCGVGAEAVFPLHTGW